MSESGIKESHIYRLPAEVPLIESTKISRLNYADDRELPPVKFWVRERWVELKFIQYGHTSTHMKVEIKESRSESIPSRYSKSKKSINVELVEVIDSKEYVIDYRSDAARSARANYARIKKFGGHFALEGLSHKLIMDPLATNMALSILRRVCIMSKDGWYKKYFPENYHRCQTVYFGDNTIYTGDIVYVHIGELVVNRSSEPDDDRIPFVGSINRQTKKEPAIYLPCICVKDERNEVEAVPLCVPKSKNFRPIRGLESMRTLAYDGNELEKIKLNFDALLPEMLTCDMIQVREQAQRIINRRTKGKCEIEALLPELTNHQNEPVRQFGLRLKDQLRRDRLRSKAILEMANDCKKLLTR